jgi:hypothetical protein
MGRIGIAVICFAAGLLAVLGWQATHSDAGRGPAALPTQNGEDLAELRKLLEAESDARQELAEQVEELERWLTDLEIAALAAAPEETEDPGAVGTEASSENGAREPDPHSAEVRPPRHTFDEQALIEAGLRPDEAAYLRERYEQSMLDRLYLRDQAVRDGWQGRGHLATAQSQQEQRLQEELGLESYDLMLYGAGRRNRVVVGDVFSRSAGEGAGLKPGDMVRSYGGRPIFSIRELRGLTTQGEPGEYVSLEVERSGRLVRLELPRGPIGVMLRPERVLPEVN